jgi:hypothetical protein
LALLYISRILYLQKEKNKKKKKKKKTAAAAKNLNVVENAFPDGKIDGVPCGAVQHVNGFGKLGAQWIYTKHRILAGGGRNNSMR